MLKKNLDVASVEKTLQATGVNLEEVSPQAQDMNIEIEFVVEQFSGYIIAVQEWGAWFGPALATLERCREPYKNRRTLEEMNNELQVSSKQEKIKLIRYRPYTQGNLFQVVFRHSALFIRGCNSRVAWMYLCIVYQAKENLQDCGNAFIDISTRNGKN